MLQTKDLTLHLGRAIRNAYGQDTGLVTDLIAFLYARLGKEDNFTLAAFCAETSHMEHELLDVHPLLQGKHAAAVPFFGDRLESLFDYCLYRMAQTKLLFDSSYLSAELEQITSLHSFQVLDELRIDRGPDRTLYAPRLSLELVVLIGSLPSAV